MIIDFEITDKDFIISLNFVDNDNEIPSKLKQCSLKNT